MVDEEGRPSLDLGHVIASLNKLDAGVPDQVVLTSRDDRNYLIVSYAELKKYMDAAFMELLEASQSPISPTSSHS
ncbi:PAB-dependent poly(A)-specific ribonuclease subunit 3 [Coelomomyces lativittatus]|nr:PAB-dependent poly(A)-specific ribonuclease subunit 3 [Coelomomyces lativittatus]